MILSGWKRSATCRANRRITRMGTSAPRYQRVGRASGTVRRLRVMPSFYHDENAVSVLGELATAQAFDAFDDLPHGCHPSRGGTPLAVNCNMNLPRASERDCGARTS